MDLITVIMSDVDLAAVSLKVVDLSRRRSRYRGSAGRGYGTVNLDAVDLSQRESR